MKNDQKETVNKITKQLTKSPTARLLMGVGSGWLAGVITVRGGRVPVVVLGGSIILFQIAQNQGLVKQSWKDVKDKATSVKDENKSAMQNVKQFADDNPAFVAGFTGGFLIGLAC